MYVFKITPEEFAEHRNQTAYEYDCPFRGGKKIEKACYCGHTDMCECSDPDLLTMKANKRRTLVANISTLTHNDI